jgi:hypothetical protein
VLAIYRETGSVLDLPKFRHMKSLFMMKYQWLQGKYIPEIYSGK